MQRRVSTEKPQRCFPKRHKTASIIYDASKRKEVCSPLKSAAFHQGCLLTAFPTFLPFFFFFICYCHLRLLLVLVTLGHFLPFSSVFRVHARKGSPSLFSISLSFLFFGFVTIRATTETYVKLRRSSVAIFHCAFKQSRMQSHM